MKRKGKLLLKRVKVYQITHLYQTYGEWGSPTHCYVQAGPTVLSVLE